MSRGVKLKVIGFLEVDVASEAATALPNVAHFKKSTPAIRIEVTLENGCSGLSAKGLV